MAYSDDHGWRVGAISYDSNILFADVGLSTVSGSDSTYDTIVDRIEQLDVVASPSGQVAVCGITETGLARLYLMDPQNNTTQIDTYSLDPLGTSYDECAITSGISGMLVVTLLSGTTISQGAIEIP
jgi:hypothetical protein